MEDKKVSVIVPLYNGEKYVVRCIESVLNQSYKNIELIIIDDNSNDYSYKIIQEYLYTFKCINYLKNDTRIGPAETRNRGLKYAKGEYVLFLDCDDWIDLNCIENAIEKFESNPEIDIVLWEIKTAYEYAKVSSRYEYIYNNVLTNNMALSLLSHTFENEFFLSPLLGCKLFKKSLLDINNIIFPDTIYEDDMFSFLSFLYANKVALITGCCLYYYQHSESLTHHFTEKHITDFFKTFSRLYNYIDDKTKEYFYRYLNKSLQSMIDCLYNNSDLETVKKFKTLIFCLFYENINIEEYYSYSFTITI
ncbi:MAG: glycosyltransferase family 2 protein [Bacilli bacterium]|nr:glycosyltransferase family 2 protein [Clostridia bacterium]MBQ6992840.1 glycosyltransferase family 2 protein [Clostridia bacterium]MBQ7140677.1 glycosyltransferase family 2 protein [Bacilli bacterium]